MRWNRARLERCLPGILVLVVACGDSPNVEFDMNDDSTFADAEPNYAADDEFAILTENGAVKLGLTSERLYFEVSQAVRDHVDQEISNEMKENDSRIARSISGAVRRGVQSAMSIDIDFDLDEIRDVDYRNGELEFEFVNDQERSLDNIKIDDDEPITRSFSEEDAQAFVDAFRRVKAGESLRLNVEAGPGKSADSLDDKRTTADSAGGSF